MNIVFYFIIFIIGTLVGSFLTLATYRIPLNQDITHKRSYCPNCNHRLEFWDLIPVWSYIFLGAKCRYCKKKISPRYFLIEVFSGLAFVFLALGLGFDIYKGITSLQIIEFVIWALYIVFLFLVGQIDKEHRIIDKRVLIYGFVISIIKVIFDYLLARSELATYNLNRIIIYLIAIIILNLISIKNKRKDNYYISLMIICAIMGIYTYEISTILSIIYALLIMSVILLLNKITGNEKKNENEISKRQPIVFYLAISNAVVIFLAIINSL